CLVPRQTSLLYPFSTLVRSGRVALVGEQGHLLCAPRLNDGGDVVHRVFAAIDGVGHLQVVLRQHKNLLLCNGKSFWKARFIWSPDRKSTRLNSSHVSISYAV